MANAFAEALDAIFEDDNFGDAAVYTPPDGGVAVSCFVIRSREDKEVGLGAAIAASDVIDVRQSELRSPKKGGVFQIGTTSFVILEDPRTTDDDTSRLAWRMTIKAQVFNRVFDFSNGANSGHLLFLEEMDGPAAPPTLSFGIEANSGLLAATLGDD